MRFIYNFKLTTNNGNEMIKMTDCGLEMSELMFISE